jgi:hypothetical protein
VSGGNESEVLLGLIERHSFNMMDGKKIAAQLRADRHLWDGVLFLRTDYGITLRDLPNGSYNADTVVLLTDEKRRAALYEIVKGWEPHSITVLTALVSFQADRYADEYAIYELKSIPAVGEDLLSRFLGSHKKDEERAVIRLWWD